MPSIPSTLILPHGLSAVLVALSLLLVMAATRATPAHASPAQLSVMMDDDQLVYRDDRTRDRALASMKALGVDMVRVTLLWSVVADHARSTPAQRRRFVASNPSTYPVRNWDRYDGVVRTAQRLGIAVYFDVTGPGPSWGHGRAPASHRADQRTWMPKAREFYKFVTAVGRRYSGTYRARNHQVLPRVVVWSLWNEPNQGGWLTPQWAYNRGLHRVAPASPAIYRSLFLYGRKALDDTGHGRDYIFAGETAPLGSHRHSTRSAMYPKQFIRELLCAGPTGRPFRGASAASRGCTMFDKFGPLRAVAWAHHPYTKRLPPTVRDRSRDSITMANLAHLPNLLDQLARSTHHVASGLSIISSEFGFETNPPDPYNGTSLAKQAEYINVADYLAFANPRVAGQTQFLLTDAAPLRQYPRTSRKYWFTYQSGLYFLGQKPKPALRAYVLPIHAFGPSGTDPRTGRHLYSVWGQLRFRRPIGPMSPERVTIEFRPSGGGAWRAAGPEVAVTNSQGFFGAYVPVGGSGSLRAHWRGSAAPRDWISREVRVGG